MPPTEPTQQAGGRRAAALRKLFAAHAAEVEAMAELISSVGAHDPGSDVYLSTQQLSQRIPYTASTIRNMVSAGVFEEGVHYFRKNGRVLFSWHAVRAWVMAGDGADSQCEAALPAEPFDQRPRHGGRRGSS